MHEVQRYGKRAPAMDAARRVNKATFMNQIAERQNNMYMQSAANQPPVEPVQEEVNQEAEANANQPLPDGGLGDDESAATEIAEAPGPDGSMSPDEWQAVVDKLWSQYDVDNSGFLDRQEMAPLCQAALEQVGFGEQVDPATIDAFFAEVDSDGNGKIDKSELLKFMKSLA